MASNNFEQSLLGLTNSSPWDQAIFLSSQTINDAFKNMFYLAKATDPKFKPVCYIDMNTRVGKIQATLKPSTVILNVEQPKGPPIYFQWNIDSGVMSLYTSDDPNDYTTTDFNISGWTVAFTTRMGEETLPTGSERYNAIMQRMGNPAGDFSLASLFIDIEAGANRYREGSNFCGTDWEAIQKNNPVVERNFNFLCDAWAVEMRRGWHTTVASRLCTNKPETVNPNVPTFPPTFVCHDLYGWRETPTSACSNTSTANALCYLIMTQNKKAPQEKVMPYTGTWVTTKPGMPARDALMCISYDQFWESWLLPKLQRINKYIQVQPEKLTFEPDGYSNCKYVLGFKPGFCMEHPNEDDKYWQFTRQSDNRTWKWKGNNDILHSQREFKNHEFKWTLDEGASAETTLSFQPSAGEYGAIITLTGTVQIHAYLNGTVALTSWGTAWMSSEMRFEISYLATNVDNGGLQIHELKRFVSEPSTKTKGPTGVIKCNPPWSDVAADTMANVKNNFNYCVNSFADELLTEISNQHKFVVPGAGDFLCSRVMFNNRGDLLVNLALNGATPPNTNQRFPALLESAPKAQKPSKRMAEFAAKYLPVSVSKL